MRDQAKTKSLEAVVDTLVRVTVKSIIPSLLLSTEITVLLPDTLDEVLAAVMP